MSDHNLLDVLTREGVLINVSVRYWRAARKLRPEDLGLDPDSITSQLISLGHKKLVPREALKRFALIESRAHALVEASTFPFLGGIARFLPNNRLSDITSRLDGLEQEFYAALTAFKERYQSLRREASREWREAARRLVSDPERLVAQIEAGFPHPGRLDGYFSFQSHLFQVAVPDALPEQVLVEAGNQQALAEARRQAAEDASRKISAASEQFVADCVATLRRETAGLCEEMLQSMSGGKTRGVHQKTLNRLVAFIERFKQLNFAGDADMEEQLEAVREQFLSRSAEDYRHSAAAQSGLQEGLARLRDHARELAAGDAHEIVERFGQMGRRRLTPAA